MATRKKTKKINPISPKNQMLARAFQAAFVNNTTNDWLNAPGINIDVQGGLRRLRERARDLVRNNTFAARYISLTKNNIVGANGIQINPLCRNTQGKVDEQLEETIEAAWNDWGKFGVCSVDGKHDFTTFCQEIVGNVATNGEAIIKINRGRQFGRYGFQLQHIAIERLDENYHAMADNGNTIFQGIEIDEYGKPVNYYIWRRNPYDSINVNMQVKNNRDCIPAADIIHLFYPTEAEQVRGYSWLTQSMLALHHIDEYKKSEMIAARIGTLNNFFFQQIGAAELPADDTDEFDNRILNLTPGGVGILPSGWDIKTLQAESPNPRTPDFIKSTLRGAASGLDVSYNAISGDLESVNYSSARFGYLQDVEAWKSKQTWFISSFIEKVYEQWATYCLLNGTLSIPSTKFNRVYDVEWRPKSFGSVDPQKDANAFAKMVGLGAASRSDWCRSQGRSFEDVIEELAWESKVLEENNICEDQLIKYLNATAGVEPDEPDGDSGDENTEVDEA